MTATFKWHGPAVERKLTANRDKALFESAKVIKGQSKLIVPKVSHNLERSIDVSEIVNGSIYVFTPVKYAIYVEYGTGIYAVGGGGRKTPWWYYNEKYGKFIKTRGYRPQSFFRKTIDLTKDKLNGIFIKYMGQL